MWNKKQKMIDFLLNNANPFIQLRVKNEVLHSLTNEEAADYQAQILKEPNIQMIMACQKETAVMGACHHKLSDGYGIPAEEDGKSI